MLKVKQKKLIVLATAGFYPALRKERDSLGLKPQPRRVASRPRGKLPLALGRLTPAPERSSVRGILLCCAPRQNKKEVQSLGDSLLSLGLKPQLPLALGRLTSLFEMGRGFTSPLSSPRHCTSFIVFSFSRSRNKFGMTN